MHEDSAPLDTILRGRLERHCISFNYLYVKHCIYSHRVRKMKQERSISVASAERYVSQWRLRWRTRVRSSIPDRGTNDARCHGSLNHAPSHSPVLESPLQEDILQAVLTKISQGRPWGFCQGLGQGPQPHWHWSLIQWLHFSRTHFLRGRFTWPSFPV